MNITFNYGMARKGYNGENPTWLGRCWGFWFPRINWNGGNFLRTEVCDVSLSWLCFWVGFILWPYMVKQKRGKDEL